MRDFLLVGVIFLGIGLTFRQPFVGILMWAWISVGAPHEEVWGFSHAIPLNLLVAASTMVAWFISPERRLPPQRGLYWALLGFLIWMTINAFFAAVPDWSWQYWDRFWKTLILGLFVAGMATNRVRIHALIWIIVLSLFYFGVKGGIFTLMTGGQFHVIGPPRTDISDNNNLALALLLSLPLANYLRVQSESKLVSTMLLAGMGFVVVAVVGSYSRGAFLGLGVLMLAALTRVRRKFLYIAIAVALIIPVLHFMPESFHERIGTLSEISQDDSFMGRVTAWQVAFFCAVDYFPFGAGLYAPQLNQIYHYYFPKEISHAAHSIFFQVLGEQGFIGLTIYLLIIAGAFLTCARVLRAVRNKPELNWAHDLASMIQLVLVVFCVAGAALSMAYYDVFILCVAVLLPLQEIVRKHNRVTAKEGVPVPAEARPVQPALLREGYDVRHG
jgi:probable O-glycosylation ligase (exosortase A-associated)